MFIVREKPEVFGLFTKPWAKVVNTYEEALQLVQELEAEDKAYDTYRPDFYEIIIKK